MNADKTLSVGGFDCHYESLEQDHLAFAFIGVHRRSSAVNLLYWIPGQARNDEAN
jgi:hypothetical protein